MVFSMHLVMLQREAQQLGGMRVELFVETMRAYEIDHMLPES